MVRTFFHDVPLPKSRRFFLLQIRIFTTKELRLKEPHIQNQSYPIVQHNIPIEGAIYIITSVGLRAGSGGLSGALGEAAGEVSVKLIVSSTLICRLYILLARLLASLVSWVVALTAGLINT